MWKMLDVQPDEPPGSALEHRLAHAAHWGLYGLLIVLPVTGYVGTSMTTDFGLFTVPCFRYTAIFEWTMTIFGITYSTTACARTMCWSACCRGGSKGPA